MTFISLNRDIKAVCHSVQFSFIIQSYKDTSVYKGAYLPCLLYSFNRHSETTANLLSALSCYLSTVSYITAAKGKVKLSWQGKKKSIKEEEEEEITWEGIRGWWGKENHTLGREWQQDS